MGVAAGTIEEAPEPEATKPLLRGVKPTGVPQPTEVARRPPPRRPPPPIPLGAAGDLDVTPSQPQPATKREPLPPPVALSNPGLGEQNRALETAPIDLPPSINLEAAVDDDGTATEEPTQVMAPSPDLLRKALGSRVAVPKVPLRISTPTPPDRGPLWIGLLAGIGVIAGISGGLLYRSHVEAEQERIEQEQKREAMAAAEDAGRWAAIIASQLAQADAGAPEATPPDAGAKGLPVPTAVDAGAPAAIPAGATPCPAAMALLPAGTFKMGTRPDDPMMGWDETELKTVRTNAYCIDLYEFPNQPGAKPTTGVSFAEATAACQTQGKRLCSEEEWERACKGPANSRFPWGDKFDAKACNTQGKQLEPAGALDRCRSGYGVFDMSGNAAEWTSSRYAPGAGGKATKGGSASSKEADARCAARAMVGVNSKNPMLGFRCCLDGPP